MNTYNNLKIYNTLNIPLVFENGKTRVSQDISSNFKTNSLFVVKNVSATTFQSWYNVSKEIGNNEFSQLQIIKGEFKVGCYIGYKENFKLQKFSNRGDNVYNSFINTVNNGGFKKGSFTYRSGVLVNTDVGNRLSTQIVSTTKFTNPCYLKPSLLLSDFGKGGCTNMFSTKFNETQILPNDIIEGDGVKFPWSYNNFLMRCPFLAEYGLYINSRYANDKQINDPEEVTREVSSNLFNCNNNVLTLILRQLTVTNPVLSINNKYFSNFLNENMSDSSLAGIFIDVYQAISNDYIETYKYKITPDLQEIILPSNSFGANKITVISLYSDKTEFNIENVLEYVIPFNVVDHTGYLVDGYYSGSDGITEVLKQINIACTDFYKVTINKFNDKLEYESLNLKGVDLYITNGYKVAPFFGFTNDFVIPNIFLGGLLKINPIFNSGTKKYYSPIPIDLFSKGKFANVKIQLMNFSSAGFIGESLDLIRIPASGVYGKLIEVSSPFFEKFLPTSGQLQQLSLFLTDNSGQEIVLYDPVYINFQIQVYEIINNMIGGVSEGNEIRGTGYKRTNYII